jgi:sn-glycerol 3-phosphate transport system ATP-binding protein
MNLVPTQRGGRDLLLGVRPEHLEPCSEREAAMTVDVDLIEPLGADTLVYGQLGSNGAGARVAVRLGESAAVRPGRLPVRYDTARAHWFDAATGLRVEG